MMEGNIPRAAWWLPGPHLPTIYGKLFRRVPAPPTVREHWPMPDGDVLSIDRMAGKPEKPRLVLFHGLEGGAHSTYVRGVLREAHARGWWADLVLWRTCDDEPVNAVRRSYHSGASDDADFAISRILAGDPARDTLLCGVSLGGNVLLKWLGERGQSVPPAIRAAAAISVPFDLALASRKIDAGFASVYSTFFLRSLKAKIAAKLERFPDIARRSDLAAVHTLWAFDDLVTAPVHGFADAADYYKRSSSIQYLARIGTPTLLLSAQNDPFLPRSVLADVQAIAQGNPHLHCVFPEHGGHVGFIAGPGPWKPDYWMEAFSLDWLENAVK
jgi:hypothetical protein